MPLWPRHPTCEVSTMTQSVQPAVSDALLEPTSLAVFAPRCLPLRVDIVQASKGRGCGGARGEVEFEVGDGEIVEAGLV